MKLLITLCLLFVPLSLAQLSYKGELEVASGLSVASSNVRLTDALGLTLRGHLELDYSLSPVDFRVVLDPTVSVTEGVAASFFAPGVTEVFALYRVGTIDLSAGLERLPLEYARLSVPLRLESVGKAGQPLGLGGARATFYVDAWRVRTALIYRYEDYQLGSVLSVRRDFTDFELEAHALYLERRFAAGLGGSGLLGNIVLYGEAWLLSNPFEGRGAFGLSGFWGDALWTAEAAYAPNPQEPFSDAFPQLLGQLSLPQGEQGNWDFTVATGLTDSLLTPDTLALQGLASATYTYSEGDYQLSTGVSLTYTELATLYGLRLSFTTFF